MNAERNHEEIPILKNIVPCDPVLADILKDCYRTIVGRENKGNNSYFEKGLKHSIENLTKDGFEIRNRQSKAFLKSFRALIQRKEQNSWIKSEKEIYDAIEGLFFVKLIGEDGDISKVIGDFSHAIMHLDFDQEVPTFSTYGTRKNLFNYFTFVLKSVAEQMSDITVSKKAFNALSEVYSNAAILITDNKLKIRTSNNVAEDVFNQAQSELKSQLIFSVVPELGVDGDSFFESEPIIRKPILVRTEKFGLSQVNFSFLRCERDEEIDELVFVLDFSANQADKSQDIFEISSTLSNVIEGLHTLRNSCKDNIVLETSSSILQNLYQMKENADDLLLDNDTKQGAVSMINFDLIFKRTLNEIRFLVTSESVQLNIKNNLFRPFESDERHIYTILKNLVANAVQFRDITKNVSTVAININDNVRTITISIIDNGIGMSSFNVDLIYGKGYKIDMRSDNLGFGLYFVKNSVQQLGGKIEVESQLKKGTEFRVTLPR